MNPVNNFKSYRAAITAKNSKFIACLEISLKDLLYEFERYPNTAMSEEEQDPDLSFHTLSHSSSPNSSPRQSPRNPSTPTRSPTLQTREPLSPTSRDPLNQSRDNIYQKRRPASEGTKISKPVPENNIPTQKPKKPKRSSKLYDNNNIDFSVSSEANQRPQSARIQNSKGLSQSSELIKLQQKDINDNSPTKLVQNTNNSSTTNSSINIPDISIQPPDISPPEKNPNAKPSIIYNSLKLMNLGYLIDLSLNTQDYLEDFEIEVDAVLLRFLTSIVEYEYDPNKMMDHVEAQFEIEKTKRVNESPNNIQTKRSSTRISSPK